MKERGPAAVRRPGRRNGIRQNGCNNTPGKIKHGNPAAWQECDRRRTGNARGMTAFALPLSFTAVCFSICLSFSASCFILLLCSSCICFSSSAPSFFLLLFLLLLLCLVMLFLLLPRLILFSFFFFSPFFFFHSFFLLGQLCRSYVTRMLWTYKPKKVLYRLYYLMC